MLNAADVNAESQAKAIACGTQRLRIRVTGVVQGVGFRPFAYRIAMLHGLSGWVLNDPDGVLLEVEGVEHALAAFYAALQAESPPLARITSVHSDVVTPLHDAAEGFVIRDSERSGSNLALLPVDSHVCDACLAEMCDPCDRRYRYPFINCTNCGPRYSLIGAIPYDRANTTMRHFDMCAACETEYRDPSDRRYHAQPNACHVCGPQVELHDASHTLSVGDAATLAALAALREGLTVAVKSVGVVSIWWWTHAIATPWGACANGKDASRSRLH